MIHPGGSTGSARAAGQRKVLLPYHPGQLGKTPRQALDKVVGRSPGPAALDVHVALIVEVVDGQDRPRRSLLGGDVETRLRGEGGQAQLRGEPLQSGQVREGLDKVKERVQVVA